MTSPADIRAGQRLRSQLRHETFMALVERAGLPTPVTELRFAPPRRWRFDYCFPGYGLALEVEGGVFTRGRHTRGAGYMADLEKYTEAAVLGWRLLRVTPMHLATPDTIELLKRAFACKGTP